MRNAFLVMVSIGWFCSAGVCFTGASYLGITSDPQTRLLGAGHIVPNEFDIQSAVDLAAGFSGGAYIGVGGLGNFMLAMATDRQRVILMDIDDQVVNANYTIAQIIQLLSEIKESTEIQRYRFICILLQAYVPDDYLKRIAALSHRTPVERVGILLANTKDARYLEPKDLPRSFRQTFRVYRNIMEQYYADMNVTPKKIRRVVRASWGEYILKLEPTAKNARRLFLFSDEAWIRTARLQANDRIEFVCADLSRPDGALKRVAEALSADGVASIILYVSNAPDHFGGNSSVMRDFIGNLQAFDWPSCVHAGVILAMLDGYIRPRGMDEASHALVRDRKDAFQYAFLKPGDWHEQIQNLMGSEDLELSSN